MRERRVSMANDETQLEAATGHSSPPTADTDAAAVLSVMPFEKNKVRLLERQAKHELLSLNERHQQLESKQTLVT